MSLRFMALRWLPLAAISLSALPAWAQRVPCFVVPLDGARASDASGRIDAPRLAADCASVAVQEGRVRIVFATKSNGAAVNMLAAGQKIALADAKPGQTVYTAVTQEIGSVTRRAGEAPPGKAFDASTPGAESHGAPHQEVYVPAGGLSLALTQLDAPTEFRVVAVDGRKLIQQGTASGSVVLARKGLVAGASYVFELVRAGKVWKASRFTVAEADTDSAVTAALAPVEASADMDATSRAIARSLVYEQNSLSFNRSLALREARP
jgi:hypothetical protein